jgi:hypothetical protein
MTDPTPSRAGKVEEDTVLAGVVAADGLGAVEVAGIVLIGLLVCPPLAILVVVVFVPLLVSALVLGLLVAVVSVPYLIVHRLRNPHHGHASLLGHRLRQAARALIALLPHRIVADARKHHS